MASTFILTDFVGGFEGLGAVGNDVGLFEGDCVGGSIVMVVLEHASNIEQDLPS